jgi:antitoxin component YwqK of YwqJK toxin-antitoxin module
MKKIILLITIVLSVINFYGQTNSKHTYVKDYYRKDGTHVEGHYRTEKNNTNTDNFSTKGNTNPYTGQPGYVPPDGGTPNYNSTSTPNYNSSTTYPSTTNSYSYNNPNKYEGTTNSLGQKVLTYTDGQEVFGLCKVCNDVVFNEKRSYYWYDSYSGVQKTTGGSGGTLLHGEYKFISSTGKLLVKANYNKGLENGDYITWNEDGKIKEKLHYVNGVCNYAKFTNDEGYIIEWVGQMFSKGSVKNVYTSTGIFEGKEEYFEEFKCKCTGYYPSGKIKLSCTNGMGDFYYGAYTDYYENGKIKFQAMYNDEAFEIGEWKWYKADGTLDFSHKFKYTEEKYSNGQIKEKGSFVFYDDQWLKNGRWYYYNDKGEVTDLFEFEFGKVKEKDK